MHQTSNNESHESDCILTSDNIGKTPNPLPGCSNKSQCDIVSNQTSNNESHESAQKQSVVNTVMELGECQNPTLIQMGNHSPVLKMGVVKHLPPSPILLGITISFFHQKGIFMPYL